MNTQSSSYGPVMQTLINHALYNKPMPDNYKVDGQQLMEEIKGCLNNRPVVLLKNEQGEICYRRPGLPREVQEAFLQLGGAIDVPRQPTLQENCTFSDLSNPVVCSKNTDDLEQLYKTCEKMGLLREFLIEVITHDIDYFRPVDTWGTPHTEFSPLNLRECACCSKAYDRVFSDRRYVFEQEFVKTIQSTVPNKSDAVKIISLGSGGLLQDFKMIGILLKEGFNNIDWVLVDPINSKSQKRIDQFKEFFSKIQDAHINITSYDNISEVKPSDSGAHAVLAIDFDDPAWNDLFLSKKHLNSSGTLFLGMGKIDAAISDKTKFLYNDNQVKAAALDLETFVPTGYQNPVSVAALNWGAALSIINILQNTGVSSVKLAVCPDKTLDLSTLTEIFKFYYPGMDIQVERMTENDLASKIGGAERFDFIIADQSEENYVTLGEAFKDTPRLLQISPHVMGENCTVYQFGNENLDISRRKFS